MSKTAQRTQLYFGEMAAWRYDFHRHPQLGFNEQRTSVGGTKLLTSFRIQVHRNVGRAGVVGVLQRGNGTYSQGVWV